MWGRLLTCGRLSTGLPTLAHGQPAPPGPRPGICLGANLQWFCAYETQVQPTRFPAVYGCIARRGGERPRGRPRPGRAQRSRCRQWTGEVGRSGIAELAHRTRGVRGARRRPRRSTADRHRRGPAPYRGRGGAYRDRALPGPSRGRGRRRSRPRLRPARSRRPGASESRPHRRLARPQTRGRATGQCGTQRHSPLRQRSGGQALVLRPRHVAGATSPCWRRAASTASAWR